MDTERLVELIKNSGLTKIQIAEQSGISRTTLDNVLAGADAKISTIEMLAKVLCVKVSYLFGEEGGDNANEIEQYKSEIARLSSLLNNDHSLSVIRDQQRTITRLLDRIDELEGKKNSVQNAG